MRSKVTVILLFLNVVLFYYIFHYERAPLRDILEARKKVYGPEVATIEKLVRTSRSGPTITIERTLDSWKLTEPYEWPANRNAVDRMLNELQFLEHETSFTVDDLLKSGRSLAEYGLEDPAFTITFFSAGKSYVSKIGDNTEIANRLYLLSPDGTRIHVVSRSLTDSIGLPLESLRSGSVFTIQTHEVRSLNIQTAALKVRLQRDANAHWSFEAPIRTRASKGKVDLTINALNTLAAKSFLDASSSDLERNGLASPALRVTLEGNLRKETLLIGGAVPLKAASNSTAPLVRDGSPIDPEYFAKFEDKANVFTIPISPLLIEDLRSAQEKLRDTHILDFDPRDVTAINLAAPSETGLTLQQLVPGSPPWQVVVRLPGQAPLTSSADTPLVDELLQKLRLLSAAEFLSDAPSAMQLEIWGFNRPEREISLTLSRGGGPKGADPSNLILQIGVSADKGVAFARVPPAPFVYKIVPDILDATPVIARHYRQRLLRSLPDGAKIQVISLTNLESGTPIFLKQLSESQPTWDIALSDETETRRKAIGAILTQVSSLYAKRFTADAFNPDHADTQQGPRPWKYRLDINSTSPGANGAAQNPTSTIFLTERIGGNTQLAGTAEFGGVVFEINQELIDALFTLIYREKNDPGLPQTQIAPPKRSAAEQATESSIDKVPQP